MQSKFTLWCALVATQLVEWSLPTPEVNGSDPVIKYLNSVSCVEKKKLKKKRPGRDQLQIIHCFFQSIWLAIQKFTTNQDVQNKHTITKHVKLPVGVVLGLGVNVKNKFSVANAEIKYLL